MSVCFYSLFWNKLFPNTWRNTFFRESRKFFWFLSLSLLVSDPFSFCFLWCLSVYVLRLSFSASKTSCLRIFSEIQIFRDRKFFYSWISPLFFWVMAKFMRCSGRKYSQQLSIPKILSILVSLLANEIIIVQIPTTVFKSYYDRKYAYLSLRGKMKFQHRFPYVSLFLRLTNKEDPWVQSPL